MFEITKSNWNKDQIYTRQEYLEMYGDFRSKLPSPTFYRSPERSDIFILDFSQGECGLKAYGAELFMSRLKHDVVGYAAPRVGHAAEAIAYLCEKYNKRAVFFSPASKEVSAHQAVVTAYKTSELRFVKIPAMPTLNAWIRQWAEKFGAVALPFGLANTPEVTAGLVEMAEIHRMIHGEPTEFYCAVSTGTMIRALQIGWPNARAHGVAVARNVKDGEKGMAHVISAEMPFYSPSDFMPEFNTTATYDAKAYRRFLRLGKPGAVFINVGSDKQIEKRLELIPNWKTIKSQREWKDMEAFNAI